MTTALIVVGAIAGYIVVVALIVAALCAGGVDDNLADLGTDDEPVYERQQLFDQTVPFSVSEVARLRALAAADAARVVAR